MKPLPPKPPRLGLRVSGARPGSLVRPIGSSPEAVEELPPKRPISATPRISLRANLSRLGERSADDEVAS